jgi:GTP-binding protein Era
VGKSTLLNALVGEKLSITSAKPHTTRHRILGILNTDAGQAVFVDTPGHERQPGRALHRLMSRVVHQALETCDLPMLIVEATGLRDSDRALIDMISDRLPQTIMVVNKLDKLRRREDVFPLLETLSQYSCRAYVPISAAKRINLDLLVQTIFSFLPEGEAMYPRSMSTDRDLRFRAAEIIREKLFDSTHQEVPYGLTVEIEHISTDENGKWLVHGLIWLEKESHKPIIIGKQGRQLKQVGTAARRDLSAMLDGPVHLELWAKVREHWSDNDSELRRLGFDLT